MTWVTLDMASFKPCRDIGTTAAVAAALCLKAFHFVLKDGGEGVGTGGCQHQKLTCDWCVSVIKRKISQELKKDD